VLPQLVFVQSEFCEQVWPGVRSGMQPLELQKLVELQSTAVDTHAPLLQSAVEALHWYEPQGVDAPPLEQEPLPLHVRAAVAIVLPAEQVAGAHIVPAGQRVQAPAPLQVPVVPQVCEFITEQSLPWECPLVTGPQVPVARLVLALRHEVHVVLQALFQQTPSAHVKPARHPFAGQVWPCVPLQAPLASQVPAQLSGSAAFFTGPQTLFVHV
jgi:hypothetical protein